MPAKKSKTPMTGAQRFAKYAAKMSEENHEQWCLKMREKKANYLARMSEQQKEAMRMKDKERKKAKREAAKMAKNIKPVTMYKTKPALSKATTKAFRALPSDLERAHEVVQGLARRVEEALGPREVVDNKLTRDTPVERGELKAKVINFYYQPDVSYTCPGKKDYVMVKQKDGSKVKMTKYILVLTLSEAHVEFLKSCPEAKISVDAFSKLRPPNVLLRHCLPKNVCVCLVHANITFLIEALHRQCDAFPRSHRELIRLTTCSEDNLMKEDCQTGLCKDCVYLGSVENLLNLLGETERSSKDLRTNHLWWQKERDHEEKERLRKAELRQVRLYDIVVQLAEHLKSFKVHILVKRHQELEFNSLRTIDLDSNCLLQFDFSENAEIQEQDEVQTAHWWHLQISLFTACAWVKGQASSFVIVSDYMHHDKYLTTIAIIKILSELLLKYPTISILNLFSDGAAQHFKQSFFFNAVTRLPKLLGVEHLKIIYDFFATSHGKGAVDGIGGTAKRGGNNFFLPFFYFI